LRRGFVINAPLRETLGSGPDSLWWVFQDSATAWLTLALSLSYMCGISAFVACGKHIPVLVISVAIAMEPESSVLLRDFLQINVLSGLVFFIEAAPSVLVTLSPFT
jgi:hypothetical protein